MGIISRMIRPHEIINLSLSDPKAWDRTLWNLVGSQSMAGETVTEHTALMFSAYWDGINQISNAVASLPLHLKQKTNNKNRLAEERPLYRVMHDKWNKHTTAMAGRKTLMMHVLTWGNGYAEKVYNNYGEIVELWVITPDRVRLSWENGQIVYYVKVDNEDKPFTNEKILHIPGPGFDGLSGYSIVALARKSIGLSMAMETFGSLYFGKGTHPSAVVTHPAQLKDPKAFRDAVSEVYAGLGNSHQIMVLEDGMKIEKIGIPPEDSQFLESRQFQITDVARWLNLPVHKLKEMSKSSFNNIESEERSYFTNSILPWLIGLEQLYDMQLLTEFDRNLSGRGRYYFKHNVKGFLRSDTDKQSAFYKDMLDRGVFSINEVREYEDLDPIPGGDIHLVPLNMTTLDNAGKAQEKKQGGQDEAVV